MKTKIILPLLLVAGLVAGAASCKRKAPPVPEAGNPQTPNSNAPAVSVPEGVEKILVEKYRNGEISKCSWKGAFVYSCQKNAPDGGTLFFDSNGEKIGACYYNTGSVDPICEEAADCKVIYRVDKNIWGKPGINLIED